MLESWSFSQIKKIFYCDQSLFLQAIGNQRNPRYFSILKIEWASGVTGYSCLSPLTHLGDLDIVDLRKELCRNIQYENSDEFSTVVSQMQRECLLKSLDFNFNFQNLLVNLERNQKELLGIKNNFLVTQIENLTEESIDQALILGYDTCKIKLQNSDVDIFFEKLKWLQKKEIRIRLDFNANLAPQEYFSFVHRLNNDFLNLNSAAQLDYIEDPCEYSDIQSFPRDNDLLLQIPIYLDNELPSGAIGYELHAAIKGFVLKPAMKRLDHYLAVAKHLKLELIFTSYMDHDLSILQSLSELLECNEKSVIKSLKKESQGFQTSSLFEVFEGHVLQPEGPYLNLQKDFKNVLIQYLYERHWLELS